MHTMSPGADRLAARPPTGTPAPTFAATWLRGRRFWRVVAATVLVTFAVRLLYFLFQDLAEGRGDALTARLFDEITGALLTAPLFAALGGITVRYPLVRPLRRTAVAIFAAAFTVFTVVHTTLMIAMRAALAPSFGLTGYEYAFTPARYAYEAVNAIFPAVAILALLALAESVFAERAREHHAAALEQGLLRAELSNLRLQLQPHFLFNALNTISATMYEDVAAADQQLAQLAGLLRTSLRTTHLHEVPVRDELALLEQYVGLLHARFGDRLTVHVDAPPVVRELVMPSMMLQPLVENAVRHGGLSRLGQGRVTVTLAPSQAAWGAALVVRVHDDGPPPASAAAPGADGTGLSTTRQRLVLLYGEAQTMCAGPAVAGGFEVVLRIPARADATPFARDAALDTPRDPFADTRAGAPLGTAAMAAETRS